MDKAQAGVTFTRTSSPGSISSATTSPPSLSIESQDFDYAPFAQQGGLGKAHQLFGEQLLPLLDELNEVLVG
jgi:type I restriction enzyme R subunit